jgi:DnaJ-domain-containing protein 1
MTDWELTKGIERLWNEYQESKPVAIHVSISMLELALDIITELQRRLDNKEA